MLIRLLLISFLFLLSCRSELIKPTQTVTPAGELIRQIQKEISDPYLSQAHIGVYVEDLTARRTLFRHNARKLFTPASNQKLYTTAVALSLLGADHTFKTDLLLRGQIRDSVLLGDLIIYGRGDPAISGRFFDGEAYAVFNNWADTLRALGIKAIRGDVIADDSYFDDRRLGEGWNWDDEPYYYSAQIGALSFNDNCVDVTVMPGKSVGDTVRYRALPATGYVRFENRARTGPRDSLTQPRLGRMRARNVITLDGGLPADGEDYHESITVEEPALWFLENLKQAWQRRDISVSGAYRHQRRAARAADSLLWVHHSPPLSELIRVVNKKSHNFYAEQIFKALGAEIYHEGSASRAARVVREWLTARGVALDAAVIADGSGLSRMNQIAPVATATLLKSMYYHPDFKVFYNSLPVAGVDGTLKGRMKNSPAEKVARAKTGYVRHMRTLSGYTRDRDGHDYVFSIMVNHYAVPTAYVNHLQDRLVILLSHFSRKQRGE